MCEQYTWIECYIVMIHTLPPKGNLAEPVHTPIYLSRKPKNPQKTHMDMGRTDKYPRSGSNQEHGAVRLKYNLLHHHECSNAYRRLFLLLLFNPYPVYLYV